MRGDVQDIRTYELVVEDREGREWTIILSPTINRKGAQQVAKVIRLDPMHKRVEVWENDGELRRVASYTRASALSITDRGR